MRCEDDYVAYADRPSRILNLAIPYARILPDIADPGARSLSLSMDQPAARLLHGYASTLLAHEGALSDEEQELFAGHVADLAALLLGATRDGAERARHGGARRAAAGGAGRRARQSRQPGAVARLACRAARDQRLLHPLAVLRRGTRLHRLRHRSAARPRRGALRDPARAGDTVATLALAVGFGDVSWFNQVFRRRFGMTPSEMRAGGTVPKP